MRVTKALLEEELKDIRQLMQLTRTENRHLREIIKIYESSSTKPNIAMTIALEKITDATAHVLADLREIGRRRI